MHWANNDYNRIYMNRTSRFEDGNADTLYEAGNQMEDAGATGLGPITTSEAIAMIEKGFQSNQTNEAIVATLLSQMQPQP